MPKEKMWVEWDDGTHLSQSQKKPGDFSALTRDDVTNELGQATLRPVADEEDSAGLAPMVFVTVTDRDDDRDQNSSAIAAVVIEVAKVLIPVAKEKLDPIVRQWWNQDSPPALRAAWNRLTRSSNGVVATEPAPAAPEGNAAGQMPTQDAEVSTDHATTMSGAQWRERFLVMLLAGAVRDAQWDALATARIDDADAGLHELQSALAAMSPQELSERVTPLLQGPNSVVDQESLARLTGLLGLAVAEQPQDAPLAEVAPGAVRNRDEKA